MSVIPRGHPVDTAKPAINYGGRDVDEGGGPMVTRRMGNVLDEEKQLEIVALGRLGGSLRRIEAATCVPRETVRVTCVPTRESPLPSNASAACHAAGGSGSLRSIAHITT